MESVWDVVGLRWSRSGMESVWEEVGLGWSQFEM